tara:strand:+ start:480 stop:899 length:420 start_codon:yes stop_codon:yes gene_type:complete
LQNKKQNDFLKFHHFGLALKNFSSALFFYKNLGYKCGKEIIDINQNIIAIFCESKKFPSIELVKSLNNKSPINNYLKKNNEIIYHTCYEVDISSISISELFSDINYLCVSEPKPAILFNNRNVSFYYIKNIGLIEILEK